MLSLINKIERRARDILAFLNMKKFNKKYLVLTFILLTSILTACGTKKESVTASENTVAEVSSESTEPAKSNYEDINVDKYVKVDNYKHYPIDSKSISVTDEEVETEINKLLRIETNAFEKVTTGAIKDGDGVNVSYKVTCEDTEVAKFDNTNITIGNENLFFNTDELLIGLKPGDKKTFELSYPDNYYDPAFVNKPVTVDVTINYILGKYKESALSEEFVTNYTGGECTDAKSFKEYIKKSIEDNKKVQYFSQMFQDIVDNTTIEKDISKLVNEQYEIEKQNIETYKTSMDVTEEDIYKSYGVTNEEDLEKAIKESAESAVKRKLVVEKLAKDFNIVITTKEVSDYKEKVKSSYGDYSDIYTDEYIVEVLQYNKIVEKLSEMSE